MPQIYSSMTLAVMWLGMAAIGSSGCGGLCGRAGDARLRDAPEMVKEGRLTGLDRDQLNSILGATAQKSFQSWDSAYYIGPDNACVDSTWLVLRFGPDGRVSESAITND